MTRKMQYFMKRVDRREYLSFKSRSLHFPSLSVKILMKPIIRAKQGLLYRNDALITFTMIHHFTDEFYTLTTNVRYYGKQVPFEFGKEWARQKKYVQNESRHSS